MAVTKTHPIKSTLKAAINYISTRKSTDEKLLASCLWLRRRNCGYRICLDPPPCHRQGNEPGSPPDSSLSAWGGHAGGGPPIGMELAKEILGGKYEFVLTTHIDKNHVHHHLIFNAVSFKITSFIIPTSGVITISAAPPTGFARNTVCLSSSPDRTRARAILNIRLRRTAPAIRQS